MQKIPPDRIRIELITRDGCRAGIRMQKILTTVSQGLDAVELQIFNVSLDAKLPPQRQAFITPGIWINDRLWYLGGVSVAKLRAKLEHLLPQLGGSEFDWADLEEPDQSINSIQDLICT